MTAELHPITKAHCTAHRPLDQKLLATDEKVECFADVISQNETFDDTNRLTVNTDFIVFKDSCTIVLDGIVQYGITSNIPSPEAIEYRIQTYDNGEVVPTNLKTLTGCYIQYRNPPGEVDCSVWLTATIRGSGAGVFSYVS